jgi:hypothetical protein
VTYASLSMNRTQIYLPETLQSQASTIASNSGISLAEFIRIALSEKIERITLSHTPKQTDEFEQFLVEIETFRLRNSAT